MAVWIICLAVGALASSSADWGSSSGDWKKWYTEGYKDALSGKAPPSSLVDGAEKNIGGAGTATSNTGKTQTALDLLKMVGAETKAASSDSETTEMEKGEEFDPLDDFDEDYSLPKIQGAVYEVRRKMWIMRRNLTHIRDFNEILKNNTEKDVEFLEIALETMINNTKLINDGLNLLREIHSDVAEEVIGDSNAVISQCNDTNDWNCDYEDSDCGNEWDAVEGSSDLKCQYCVKSRSDPRDNACTERSDDPCFAACTYNSPQGYSGAGSESYDGPADGVCQKRPGIGANWLQKLKGHAQNPDWSCETHCMRYFDGANVTGYAGSNPSGDDASAGTGAACVSDPCQTCDPSGYPEPCTGETADGKDCGLNCVKRKDRQICQLFFSAFYIVTPQPNFATGVVADVGNLHITTDISYTYKDVVDVNEIWNDKHQGCDTVSEIAPGSFFSTRSGKLCLPQCSGERITSRDGCFNLGNCTENPGDATFQVVGGLPMQCIYDPDNGLCVPQKGCWWPHFLSNSVTSRAGASLSHPVR